MSNDAEIIRIAHQGLADAANTLRWAVSVLDKFNQADTRFYKKGGDFRPDINASVAAVAKRPQTAELSIAALQAARKAMRPWWDGLCRAKGGFKGKDRPVLKDPTDGKRLHQAWAAVDEALDKIGVIVGKNLKK